MSSSSLVFFVMPFLRLSCVRILVTPPKWRYAFTWAAIGINEYFLNWIILNIPDYLQMKMKSINHHRI